MTENWERITALFGAARLLDPDRRAAFLAAACGDDAVLRQEVERLLAESAQDDSFLAEPPAIAASLLRTPAAVDNSIVGLAPGTRLAEYEVVALIGSGGMGEVYRARDVTLNRDVALKVLPALVAGDPERRKRFEREAQAVAALNHPNIVTIHSVEQADGQFFLTMELVEGRSLADLIPDRGLAIDRLLGIAIPLTDAVAAAHQKGITHRDLKPANIMVGDGAQNGRVKVLDFGLAKLTEAVSSEGGATAMPTTPPMTGEGRIVGTVAYMSPEQAEGKALDARSDLFSLGVILFEMATGTRPFAGETSMSIISSILKDTPQLVTDLNPTMPRDLARIIRRALRKDPERRYQTAKDLRNDLEELKESLGSAEVPTPVPTARASRTARVLVGAAAIGVLASGLATYILMFRSAQPAGSSAAGLKVTPLTSTGDSGLPTISPDGKYVVYVRQQDDGQSLWLKQIATSRDVEIVASEPATVIGGATITPDGAFVDFIRSKQSGINIPELWRVPLLGGAPKKLLDKVMESLLAWSHDGRQMAFTSFVDAGVPRPPLTSALIVADADGDHQRVVATRRAPVFLGVVTPDGLGHPAWSPDGRMVAVLEADYSSGSVNPVVIDVATGQTRSVPALYRVLDLAWPRPEMLIVNGAAHAGAPAQLFRMDAATGRASALTNDLSDYSGVSVTADGRMIAASRFEQRMQLWIGDANARRGADIPTSSVAHNWRAMLAWANGRVLHTAAANGTMAIMSIATDAKSLPETVVEGTDMAASRDGATLVFISTANYVGGELWRSDIDGTHRVRITPGQTRQPALSKNGDVVFFVSGRTGDRQTLWSVPTRSGTPVELAHRLAVRPAVSPDGTQLVFGSVDDQNRNTLVICDLPACANPRTVGTNAFYARWLPSGSAVAYVTPGDARNLFVQPLDGGAPSQLTHFSESRIQDFGWSADGTRLAILRSSTTADLVLFRELQGR